MANWYWHSTHFLYLSVTVLPVQLPNLPQLEDYHIVARDSNHLLIVFCHGMPEVSLNGMLVLSRTGRHEDLSQRTLERFEAAVVGHGYDPQQFCTWDNSVCTNGSRNPSPEHRNLEL